MTEPTYSDTTERMWSRLPAVYRREDALQDWQFKKWLAGITDQAGVVDTYSDRFEYIPPEDGPGHRTSDLVDPQTADFAWLPWLAQLVGVKLDPNRSEQQQRDQISNANFKAGSPESVMDAARTVLVGDKFVSLISHSITTPGDGGQWDVLLLTLASETLDNDVPIQESTMNATDAWSSACRHRNVIAGTNPAWTVSGMTAGTGSTNPLNGTYRTLSGAGNGYLAAVAYPSVTYWASIALRCDDGLATSATVEIVFMNGGAELSATALTVPTLGTTWQIISGSATAPANTTHVRLRITRGAAGVLLVQLPYVSPDGLDVFFDSGFTGDTQEDSVEILPPINYARNPGFKGSSGWTATDGTNTQSTARFKYGTTSGLFEVTAVGTPKLEPNADTPIFEGERVRASVWAMSALSTGTARLSITYTKADGSTSTVNGSNVGLVESSFTELTLTDVAPANAKTCRVNIQFMSSTVGKKYYVDGWTITRGNSTHEYFDGDSFGCSWSSGTMSDAITIGSTDTAQHLESDPDILYANLIQMTANNDRTEIRVSNNYTTYGEIPVTATDPYTHVVDVRAKQAGPYQVRLQAIYYTAGSVETGRASTTATAVGTDITQLVISTASVPATSTKVRLIVHFNNVNQGDKFEITRVASRLGDATAWVPEPADPVAAVIAAGAKPAGVLLHHQSFGTTWDDIEAAYPDWASWDAVTWQDIEESGL